MTMSKMVLNMTMYIAEPNYTSLTKKHLKLWRILRYCILRGKWYTVKRRGKEKQAPDAKIGRNVRKPAGGTRERRNVQ